MKPYYTQNHEFRKKIPNDVIAKTFFLCVKNGKILHQLLNIFSIYFIELGITQNLYKSNKKGTTNFIVIKISKLLIGDDRSCAEKID